LFNLVSLCPGRAFRVARRAAGAETMCAMAVAPQEAPRESVPARAGGPAPLFIVCSPNRRVGKTLVARFIAEYYLADERPIDAYDLADEAPQLADYLPKHTAVVDISDVRSQMGLFDGLLADATIPKVIDVGHRMFGVFFAVAHKIDLFEEARRRRIEPVILFMIDPDQRAEKAYALLRRSFPGISLLPARNLKVAKGLRYGATFPHASKLAAGIEIAELPSSLQPLIDRPNFSFADFPQRPQAGSRLSVKGRDELLNWIRRFRFQLREIELCLIYEQILSALR
jgi:hypothetical protein